MPLYLTEDDVARFLTMEACIDAVEGALRHLATGSAANRPRSRATTSPFVGSSITRTPGIAAATSPVLSALALLMSRISSGSRLCARME